MEGPTCPVGAGGAISTVGRSHPCWTGRSSHVWGPCHTDSAVVALRRPSPGECAAVALARGGGGVAQQRERRGRRDRGPAPAARTRDDRPGARDRDVPVRSRERRPEDLGAHASTVARSSVAWVSACSKRASSPPRASAFWLPLQIQRVSAGHFDAGRLGRRRHRRRRRTSGPAARPAPRRVEAHLGGERARSST